MEEQERQKTDQPNVHVFGQEFEDWKRKRREEREHRHSHYWRHDHHDHGDYHHHHGGGLWGITVLLVGLMLLANTIGLIPWEVWRFIWPFWPVLIVIFGLRIVLGHIFGAEGLVFLVALVAYGFIIIYVLAHIGSPLVRYFPQSIVNFASSTKIIYFK